MHIDNVYMYILTRVLRDTHCVWHMTHKLAPYLDRKGQRMRSWSEDYLFVGLIIRLWEHLVGKGWGKRGRGEAFGGGLLIGMLGI